MKSKYTEQHSTEHERRHGLKPEMGSPYIYRT